MTEIPEEAVRAVAEILRDWEVDRSGEPIDPVEEFDAEALELLEAAAPLIAEQARADERRKVAAEIAHAIADRRCDFRACEACTCRAEDAALAARMGVVRRG